MISAFLSNQLLHSKNPEKHAASASRNLYLTPHIPRHIIGRPVNKFSK